MDEQLPPKQPTTGTLSCIGEDLLLDILSRLPALSFASATCVNHSLNRICNQILSRPKMLSALSLNPSLEVAVNEVLNKVLAEPIRPHFVISCIGHKFSLKKTHQLVTKRFGSKIPIITSQACGIIGGDALTNQFKEVQWVEDETEGGESYNAPQNVNRGIVMIVGFVPGLKVAAIPLLQTRIEPRELSMVDKFVTDIREFSTSVSGSTSPVGIIMFADQHADMKPVLDKMNCALSEETVIVGDESGCFLYNNEIDSTSYDSRQQSSHRKNTRRKIQQSFNCEAISLVFATDRGNPHGVIRFNLALSTGVSPVGPLYKAASVRVDEGKGLECSTWLTARTEESLEMHDGQRILHDIENAMDNNMFPDDLYIGVMKRRKISIGLEKKKLVSSLVFHELIGGDEEYLFVKGDGIRTGDSFCFFCPDPRKALTARDAVFDELRDMKQRNGVTMKAFGGLVFSCYGKGESFFSSPNVDSSAFLENFQCVPLAGIFCRGEIGRVSSALIRQDIGGQKNSAKCFLHVYSSLYLLMFHTPIPLGQ